MIDNTGNTINTSMAKIVAVCNQKGGVGKTALTINLGAALADLDNKVLLVDLDPQGHLTEGIGQAELYLENNFSLFDWLTKDKENSFKELIYTHPSEKFSFVPSNYQMMLAEQALYMARNREHKLKRFWSQVKDFDWVLLDCPPNLGNLTDNALNAARQVVVPIEADTASVRALGLLMDQIESIERGLNIRIHLLAVVPNKVQDTNLSRRILTDLRQSIPVVTPFDFRRRVFLQNAWDKGRSIFGYKTEGHTDAQTQDELMNQFRQLAKFITEKAKGDIYD